MRKQTTETVSESRPERETLEHWLKGQMQDLVQHMLESELTEFLGRAKSVCRSDSDRDSGYRNGYARPRKLTLSSGTIEVSRPRVRNTEEKFASRLHPLFTRRTNEVSELIPQLYLHGLSEGDFDLALRGLLGDDAPVSAPTVARQNSLHSGSVSGPSRPACDLKNSSTSSGDLNSFTFWLTSRRSRAAALPSRLVNEALPVIVREHQLHSGHVALQSGQDGCVTRLHIALGRIKESGNQVPDDPRPCFCLLARLSVLFEMAEDHTDRVLKFTLS